MKGIRILLAEDDLTLGNMLCAYLKEKGYDTTLCENGVVALNAFNESKYTFCLLDIMMPEMDGITLAKEIRKIDTHVPIVFLTAKREESDVIEGFGVGADDYIQKPFSMGELLCRINAIQNRIGTAKSEKDVQVYKLGRYVFDTVKRVLVFDDEKNINLTTKESELLLLLCENKNRVLERNFALKNVWTGSNYFNARSMDVYITRLRKYLQDDPNVCILNIHGRGYKLIVEK